MKMIDGETDILDFHVEKVKKPIRLILELMTESESTDITTWITL